MSLIVEPGTSTYLDHSPGTKVHATWREWICPREWLSGPFPKEMTVLHQPPKQTILRNCSQLWASKEWLSGEADQCSWPLLRVNIKKRDCPRPFPMLTTRGIVVYGTSAIHWTIFIMKMTVQSGPFSELENVSPSEISIHFTNWKESVHAGLFFKLENDSSQFNNMSVLPPNLESHFFSFN